MMLFIALGPSFAPYGAAGLALLQLISFAAPVLGLARIRTAGYAVVGVRGFPLQAMGGAIVMACTVWIWSVHWIGPIGADWASAEQTAELEALFALDARPLWQSLVFFAIVPAFCEELLHRGLLLPTLVRLLGAPGGLLLSSLLFGLSHFNLARLLPTTLLGLLAAWLWLRTKSTLLCMVLHAAYNTSLLVAAHEGIEPAPTWAFFALLITAAGAAWLVHATRSLEKSVS